MTKFIYKELEPKKLDILLKTKLQISRKKSQLLIDNKQVLVNSKRAIKRGQIIKKYDKLEIISFLKEENFIIKEKQIKILYENNDFLVIDKPSGLSLEEKSSPNNPVIWNILKKQFNISNFFLVHRLDKDTTGCLIIAKNLETQKVFWDLFKNKKIQKEYLAITKGNWVNKKGIIDKNIKRIGKTNKYKVNKFGITALTKYIVLDFSKKNNISLVKLFPFTGRSHQLRVHCNYLNHSILGDKVYFQYPILEIEKQILRHQLHCQKISFFVNQKKFVFEAKIPLDMKKVIEKIKFT